MSRYITIDGKRYAWREILQLRRQRRRAVLPQPTLFELKDDARPVSERTGAGRYAEPTFFDRDPR